MLETQLTNRILGELNSVEGCKAIKTHGGQYLEAGTPDIVGCYRGHMFALEVKVGDRPPEAIQKHRLDQWGAMGAFAIIVREDFEVPLFLEAVGEAANG